jgi:hypothetical protein
MLAVKTAIHTPSTIAASAISTLISLVLPSHELILMTANILSSLFSTKSNSLAKLVVRRART